MFKRFFLMMALGLFFMTYLPSTSIPIWAKQKVKEFSVKDTGVLGIRLDMEKAEVEKILGKPKRVKAQYEGAFGDDVLYYFYAFGNVRLEPLNKAEYAVAGIIIDHPHFAGPRGIEVNDDMAKVIERFPNQGQHVIKDNMEYLYGKTDDNCGYILYQGKKPKTVFYRYGSEGFGGYTLRFDLKRGKVKQIGIFVMNI